MSIVRIVSGAQTGADRGGLDAAIECAIPSGGWCPKKRKAEDGEIPGKYAVRESRSSRYTVRTEANVVDSDATVIFTPGSPTGGSLRTLQYCREHEKPYLQIPLSRSDQSRAVQDILAWLAGDPDLNEYGEYAALPPVECVLNVAGSRESGAPGIQETVRRIMVDVIRSFRDG